MYYPDVQPFECRESRCLTQPRVVEGSSLLETPGKPTVARNIGTSTRTKEGQNPSILICGILR